MLLRIILLVAALVRANPLLAARCVGPSEIERALHDSPSANVYDALGAWFAQHRQIDCALPAFQKSLALDPNSWQTHYNFGLALLETGDQERALAEFRAAVHGNPGSVLARNALGGTLQALGRLEQAEAAFKAA